MKPSNKKHEANTQLNQEQGLKRRRIIELKEERKMNKKINRFVNRVIKGYNYGQISFRTKGRELPLGGLTTALNRAFKETGKDVTVLETHEKGGVHMNFYYKIYIG